MWGCEVPTNIDCRCLKIVGTLKERRKEVNTYCELLTSRYTSNSRSRERMARQWEDNKTS